MKSAVVSWGANEMRILTTALVISTSMAAADEASYAHSCTFTSECLETEACAETNYQVDLTYDFTILDGTTDDGAGTGKASDETADRRMIVTHSEGAFVAHAVDFSSDRLIAEELFIITSNASGDARLMTAFPDVPMVITYHGKCQGDN